MLDAVVRESMPGRSTYTWRLPYGFVADIGGPAFDLEEPSIRHRWLASLSAPSKRWVMPKQRHTPKVLSSFVVSDRLENFCDGLATSDASLGLGVFGSDCPGLILLSPKCFCVAHCGWRGIVAGIVKNAVDAHVSLNDGESDDIVAFIGPGICRRCYEVGPEVMQAGAWSPEATSPSKDDKTLLDLPLSIELELRAAGIGNVMQSSICTACDPSLHSYRHQGSGVVQALVVQKVMKLFEA